MLDSTPSSTRTPLPVVIDSDPGIDDTLALLLALRSPELDVRGIAASYGNTTVEQAYRNCVEILRRTGRRLTLGASWDHLRSEQSRFAAAAATVEESLLTVATFGNTHDITTGWEGTIGAGVALPARATVAGEFVRGHTSLRTLGDPAFETQTVERTRGGRAGVEFLVLPQLGLRAGFQRLTLIDTADHLNEVTAGAGYQLRGFLTADVLYARGTSSREAGAPFPRPTIHTHTIALITRWSL